MHQKDIKAQIRKQLKTKYPNWPRLPRKHKKKIAEIVLAEAVATHDFKQAVNTPMSQLLGIDNQIPTAGIMTIEEMGRLIASHESGKLFKIDDKRRKSLYIKDKELKLIDDLLDDQFINKLLSYKGYSPAMRQFSPSHFLRAELLKAIKYPEISYRKFCGNDKRYKNHAEHSDYIGMSCKQNRAFIGLPLNRKQMISHVQLSQFRSSLTFTQLSNLTVYILYHLKERGILDGPSLHCVDSTELAVERQRLLATVTVIGRKIRIYDDLDCDCGKRRTKRDKSVYVVGYRLHTLSAINVKTGHSIALISLVAPANHHDSQLLLPLIGMGKAVGLDLKLITADEAYHDKDGKIIRQMGTHLIKPPGSKVSLPPNVEIGPLRVNLDDMCEIPMRYIGLEGQTHEFKCDADPGQCARSGICPQSRQISIDNGYFQRLLCDGDAIAKAIDIRKNGERPFNLLKKREGLEQVRVRSQHGLVAKTTFTTMVTLLLEIVGTRRKIKTVNKQIKLPLAA